MSCTVKDLQSRPNAPLQYSEQVAPNGWSVKYLVQQEVLYGDTYCLGCGNVLSLVEALIMGIRGAADRPEDPRPIACEDCGGDILNRTIDRWC